MYRTLIKYILNIFLVLVPIFSFSQIKEADEYFTKNDYSKAIQYYERALKNDPQNLYLLIQLAESYNQLYWSEKQNYMWTHEDDSITKKNYDNALLYGKKVLGLDEKNKLVLAIVANLYYIKKNISKAFYYAGKYKELYSEDDENVSYLMKNMYANLVVYLVDTSTNLKEKQKYIDKIEDLNTQFNYLYVEYLVEQGDSKTLDTYLQKATDFKEEIDYKYIINRALKFDKSDLAALYLKERYKLEGKSVTLEQAKEDIALIKSKFNEVARYFKNVTEKNYKKYMLKSEEQLDSHDIKVLQNINYDNLNIYKEKGNYQVIIDLQENTPDIILYSLYGDQGVSDYSLQIVDTPQGFKVQILD